MRLLQNAARFGFPARLTGPDAAQLNLGSLGCNGLAAYPSVCASWPDTAEVGTAEVGTHEVGSAEVGIAEVGTHEVGSAEVGTEEVGIAEVGTAEDGIAKVGTAEVGPPEVGNNEVRDCLICPAPLIPFADSLFPTIEKLERLVAVHVFVP